MRAIPMKGHLVGKRVIGCIWAGPGQRWRQKENYFQLEHDKLVSVFLGTPSGSFWVRCKGATCEITLHAPGPKARILGTTILALPHGKKR
jgi:hypothetical protein